MTLPGKVYLVGSGPGDPDLLTVKAVRLLATAEIFLHDDLVTSAVLALANPRGHSGRNQIEIGRAHV